MRIGAFIPGQVCKVSGIYMVLHAASCFRAHEVIIRKGEGFLPCRRCTSTVGYLLFRQLPSIREDSGLLVAGHTAHPKWAASGTQSV
jgi:hypothetical protein